MVNVRRIALKAQGGFYVVTGVWPLIDMTSFEAVTGPKTDDWLVRTVGALIVAVGAAILVGARRDEPTRETVTLAVGCAAALTAIDVIYTSNGTIDRIYLADAAVEVLLIAAVLLGGTGKSPSR